MASLLVLRGALFFTLLSCAIAYIPALPSNDSSGLAEDSDIILRWANDGSYQQGINRQLQQDGGSAGIEKGALVHFYENNTFPSWDTYTSTPWIALVACDENSTSASTEDDIFTLARDRGAVAALLFSEYSQTCTLNNDYLEPPFERVLDIYTTITKSSSRLIESQFQNVNTTDYYFFNGPRLNASASAVTSGVNGTTVLPGYLIATVKLSNVTDPATATPTAAPTSSSNSGGGGASTGLAMIILYAITGCVSALFCIVIITGAIRAIRHPDRYGPRPGDPNLEGYAGEPQSRMGGLTRAIIETFPVVKFNRNNPNQFAGPRPMHIKMASESDFASTNAGYHPNAGGMQQYSMVMANQGSPYHRGSSSSTHPDPSDEITRDAPSRNPSTVHEEDDEPELGTPSADNADLTPDQLGTEICPICIAEFEDGDDLRVLPCEGQHKFHRDCVDPWLLQVSSLCPLCRKDFHALENMVNGVAPSNTSQTALHPPTPSHGASRFSRYLRTARRRDHPSQSHDEDGSFHEMGPPQ